MLDADSVLLLFFLSRTVRHEGNFRERLSIERHPPSGVLGLAHLRLHRHPTATKAGGYHGTPRCI